MAYSGPTARVYKPDAQAWKRHYEEMCSGTYVSKSIYRIKSRHKESSPPRPQQMQPRVELVAPSAQTAEAAKLQLRHERSIMDPQHLSLNGQLVGRPPPKKRGRPKIVNQPDDIFN